MDADTHPVIRWLLTDGRRINDPSGFLAALCRELRAHGVAVARMTTGIPILHPQVSSYSGLWQQDSGSSERFYHATGGELREQPDQNRL